MYEQIESCKKQGKHLGWTSYIFKTAPANEATCKTVCSTNADCDFYAYIPTALGFPKLTCWCGAYKKIEDSSTVNLAVLEGVESVTLNFKKGEVYYAVIILKIMFY